MSYDTPESFDGTILAHHEAFSNLVMNTITPSGLPPHVLNLKVGSIVMLLRNISISSGFCNGTRLRVVSLHRNTIECVDMNSPDETVILPRMPLTSSDTGLPFKLNRRQFPLRLAYAMTINKSQGQTLDVVGIALGYSGCFDHGQLYVELSRGTSCKRIKHLIPDGPLQGKLTRNPEHTYVKNIVFRDLLNVALIDPPAAQPCERLAPIDEETLQCMRAQVEAQGVQLNAMQEEALHRWRAAQEEQGHFDADEDSDDDYDDDLVWGQVTNDGEDDSDNSDDSDRSDDTADSADSNDSVEYGDSDEEAYHQYMNYGVEVRDPDLSPVISELNTESSDSDEHIDEEGSGCDPWLDTNNNNIESEVNSLSQRFTQVTVSDEQPDDDTQMPDAASTDTQ